MKIGAIIQARITSNRFPGKVLHNIAGKPMLQYLLERVGRCASIDDIVVATSRDQSDIQITDFCKKIGVAYHRGPLLDVAGRFREVLNKYKFDGFVRITGDSPLLDPELISKGMKIFRQGRVEIVTNVFKRTYPAGQSVEILDSGTFIRAYEEIRDPEDLEHVTKFFYKNSERFKIFNFVAEADYSAINLSVDTPQNMELIAAIIRDMEKPHWEYGVRDVLERYNKAMLSF